MKRLKIGNTACFCIKKALFDEQGFFYIAKKNYFLTESTAAVAVAAALSTTAVAVESTVSTTAAAVESTAVSAVLEVQAAKEATDATNKIAIIFFIVFLLRCLMFETHCKFKIILRYDASFS
jgi:hypothetical protein